jgi:SAM-dependent methyltransferase
MTISRYLAAWLDDVADKAGMKDADLLEIGTQDLAVSRELLTSIAKRRAGWFSKGRTVDEMYSNGSLRPDAQKLFYSMLGVKSYQSIDLNDSRADLAHDMNTPVAVSRQFDIVTNFGTAEHIFNVFQFFENVHRLLKPGGTALHVLPACGDVNHGFFNFHPVLFHRLAAANRYEIVDYRYVDNIAYNSFGRPADDFESPYSFAEINAGNMGAYDEVRVSAYRRMLQNATSKEAKACEPDHYFTVFDYNFVALRKVKEAPFAQPHQ